MIHPEMYFMGGGGGVISCRIKDKKVFFLVFLVEVQLSHKMVKQNGNLTKWSNTLKQFVGNLPTNCLSVFNHFVKI